MVIDNKSLSNDVSDVVYYYKATMGLKFRVGHPSLWEYAEGHTDDDPDDDRGELVPFENVQKNRPSLVVQHGPKPH